MTTLFLDIEVGNDDSLLCVGWGIDDGPVQAATDFPSEVLTSLADPDAFVVTHTKFDLRWIRLNRPEIDIRATLHDTQVMCWLVNETTPLDLESLAARYVAIDMNKRLSRSSGTVLFTLNSGHRVKLEDAPFDQLAEYCKGDVAATRALYWNMVTRLKSEGLWDYFFSIEAPFTAVLLDMESRGLPVNLEATKALAEEVKKERDGVARKLTAGLPECFNLRSPQHVGKFIASERFFLADKVRKEKSGDALDLQTLAELASDTPITPEDAPIGSFFVTKPGRLYDHGIWVCKGLGLAGTVDKAIPVNRTALLNVPSDAWVNDYLHWKKLDKLLNTYLEVFPTIAKNGRIYGKFNQTGTATGRLSSSGPNLQNIPARGALGGAVRDLFQGNLVVGDFSQLEPRLMAHFSQDLKMLDIFNNDRDIYDEVATNLTCSRDTAKVLVLAMGYGAGADKLAEILKLSGINIGRAAARQLLEGMKRMFYEYFAWRERSITQAMARGYITTLDGRRRRVGLLDWSWKTRDRTGRQAANAIIQGSAADIVRRVMIHTSRMFPELKLVAQVHDELVWEYDPATPPDLTKLKQWVERFAGRGLLVPLKFEPHMGSSWYTAKRGSSSDAPVQEVFEEDDTDTEVA